MNLFKKINCFFGSINHDIRLFNPRASFVCGVVSLILGVFSWFVGGRADKVMLIYIFPRSALSLGVMYFLWALSFFIFGMIIGGVMFGCEKYKRKETAKISMFLLIALLFMLCIYPVFFKSMSPFITFLIFLVVEFFSVLAVCSSLRVYSLWTILLIIHSLWIFYNCFLSFAIAIIN